MITIRMNSTNHTYGELEPGTIFSWPVDMPKDRRAFALKIADGKMLWFHDANKDAVFCSDVAISFSAGIVEIEGKIIIS